MEIRRYKNILAIQSEPHRIWGFHRLNLDVAELDQEAWQAMAAETNSEALNELDEWSQEIGNETEDLKTPKGIRAFSINIAQVCNLKCSYCGADGDGTYGARVPKADTTKVFRQLSRLLGDLPAHESFEIRFLGGEPLLYPKLIREISHFAQLLVAGRNIKLQFSIVTNGTLLSPENVELLAQLHCNVTISLDASAETNDKVRRLKTGGSSTQLILDGLKEIQKVRHRLRGLHVNSVFGSHNTDVLSSYQFLQPFQFDSMNLNYAASDQDETFSPRYVEGMRAVAEHALAEEGLMGLVRIDQFKRPLSRLETKTRTHDYCGAGKSLLQTDTKGDLHVCNWFMNDAKDRVGVIDHIDQKALEHYSPSLIELNHCDSCWAKHLCGGGCMFVNRTKTGDKHGKDPHFCNRSRFLAATAIDYYLKTLTKGTNNEAC